MMKSSKILLPSPACGKGRPQANYLMYIGSTLWCKNMVPKGADDDDDDDDEAAGESEQEADCDKAVSAIASNYKSKAPLLQLLDGLRGLLLALCLSRALELAEYFVHFA